MKKMIFLLIGVAMVLHGISLLPSASAFMVHKTDVFSNSLTKALIQCDVKEKTESETTKTAITVENNSTIKVYLRVRLVTYWEDSKEVAVGLPISMPEFDISGDWIKDEDEYTYYYKYPVDPNGETTNLLSDGNTIVLNVKNEKYNNVTYVYNQVVDVIAEAIQAEGTTDAYDTPAVVDAWGVTVENGIITKAP